MKNFNHKKKYGQNFLDSPIVLEKIKSVVSIDSNSNIIEIGPGKGFLTEFLLQNSKNTTCYEIDTELIPYLNNKFSKYNNFNLINADFLNEEIKGENISVVANIPYYITSPIIEKLIENRDKINEIYLMVQKEVAIRICSMKDKKDVSLLTHYVNFYAETEYLFTVEKTFFEPVPKVDSAFIKISIRKENKYEEKINPDIYFKFIKQAFSSKRKSLINNLKPLNFEKEKLEKLLENKLVRAEKLSIEEFITLIKELKYE